MENKKSHKKTLEGTVASAKMEKTLIVRTKRLVTHPKYKKRYWVSKKYKAHNPENRYKEGDEVVIQESRPLSKEKRWIIVGKAPNSKHQIPNKNLRFAQNLVSHFVRNKFK